MSLKLIIFGLGVACKIGKQLCNYAIQYFNDGKYPLPQTVIVLVIEVVKMAFTLCRTGCNIPAFTLTNIKGSLGLMVPTIVYALNNNIYYLGLTYVSPPIWMIITSIRTVQTACVYKFYLRRPMTSLQFFGALLIVISIIVTKLGDVIGKGDDNYIPPIAFVLAFIASCNSVGAAVFTETLFKNAQANFLEQQFWMYFYGIIINLIIHYSFGPNISVMDSIYNLDTMTTTVLLFLVGALLFSSFDGFLIAEILKRFDNIVKEYSGAVDNIFTAILCSIIFPDKFDLTIYIMMAMAILIYGIYLYETKRPAKTQPVSENGNTSTNGCKV